MDHDKIKLKLKDAKSVEDLLNTLRECSGPISKMNIHLNDREKEVNIKESATLRKIVDVKYFIALRKTIEKFIEKDEAETARNLLKDILVAKDENLGKFYEMMVYYFLINNDISFTPQVKIQSSECYKKGDKGYDADGLIHGLNCVFDVKMFGIVFPHITIARKKLQEKVNKKISEKIEQFKGERNENIQSLSKDIEEEMDIDKKKTLKEKLDLEKKKVERMIIEEKKGLWKYVLKIDGQYNADTISIKKHIFERLDILAEELVEKVWIDHMETWKKLDWGSDDKTCEYGQDVILVKIDGTDYTCRLHSSRYKIVTSVHESDMYEWAKNNRFYFMHDASQFVKDRPYMIICSFDKESGSPFLSFTEYLDGYFRALCRRIFMDLNRMTDRNIDDGKAVPVTISEASKKITGIIFIETSGLAKDEKKNTAKDYVWAYFNPNADNPLYDYQKKELFYIGVSYDDYRNDNY